MNEYQQDLIILAFALATFLLFGIGLLYLKYLAEMKRRPRVRHSMVHHSMMRCRRQ